MSNPAVLAILAISIPRTRRTVIEETTSPSLSFSFTLLRTMSVGRTDFAPFSLFRVNMYAGPGRNKAKGHLAAFTDLKVLLHICFRPAERLTHVHTRTCARRLRRPGGRNAL